MQFILALLGLSPLIAGATPSPTRDLIRIVNTTAPDIPAIEKTGVLINYLDREGIVAEATREEQAVLKQMGFSVVVITREITTVYQKNFLADGRYLTYEEFRDTMVIIARNNSSICKLETLGLSYSGKLLLAMKVSDHPQIHENEPATHFEGGIHGDEKIGWAIVFELLKYLVQNYGSDSLVTRMVNEREIWLLPMYNPDGYGANSRYNGNSVDLNRNWGWMWGDESNQGTAPFSEPENKAVLKHIWRNPAVTFVSYHAGTTFISHPWSYCYSSQNTIPELNLIQFLSARYDQFTHYTYGQGADSMYTINGSTKDFDYGYGMMGWSIEVHLQKTPPASQIDPTFNLNLPAMLALMHHAGQGIHGTVTDALTGEPVHSQIWISPANWPSYTNPDLGDFHRFYLPGRYTVTIRAPAYRETTFTDVVVPDTGDSVIHLNIRLTPDPAAPRFAFRHIYNSFVAPATNRSYPIYSLGPRDGVGFQLDNGKYICLDMGKPIYNQEGTDLIVYCSSGSGTATVQGANNWEGPWTNIGTANSPATEFDINPAGLDSVRYIRLVATGRFFIDAIESTPNTGITTAPSPLLPRLTALRLKSNPAKGVVRFIITGLPPKTKLLLTIVDITGRTINTIPVTGSEQIWDGRNSSGKPMTGGIYFAKLPGSPPVPFTLVR